MIIKSILLENYRNYKRQEINLDEKINVFHGNNAQGKTNVLEALYFCAFGRSFRTHKDLELISFDNNNARVEVKFLKAEREKKIEIFLDRNTKKQIKVNDIKINKNSELLGNMNLVIFSPDDIVMIKESPSSRRKFLDILISQLRPKYAHILSEYNKILENRNALLKSKKLEGIEVWDEQLAVNAERIYEYRKEYIEKISQNIKKITPDLTNDKEMLAIDYKSQFKDKKSFIEHLNKNLKIDSMRGFTGVGIHRDDFELLVNNHELNLYGSQGQHRTAILALKFAEIEIIKEEINEKPILLLDDITSELDLERIKLIFDKINGYQVLITCTDANIIRNFESLTKDIKLYKISNGSLERKES